MHEHRHLLTAIALLLALNAGLYVAYILPLSRKVSNVTERTQAARNGLAAARFANTRVANALNGKTRASQQLERFYDSVLPASVVDARRLAFPRLDLLAQESNLRANDGTFEVVNERTRTLRQLRIRMTLTGDYDGIREFIHRLERSPEFLVIDRIVLKENGLDEAPLSLQIELSTYYREQAP
jgi:hypothetical protein